MKWILILSLLTLYIDQSQAFWIDSRPAIDSQGQISQSVYLQCRADEGSFCQALCQKGDTCQIPEPLCLGCGGTSSTLMRAIFSRLTTYFEPAFSGEVSGQDVLPFLKMKNYVLLSPQSIYNYYRPWNADDVLAQFAQFCPEGAEAPLLAVILDSESQPNDLVYAFCRVPSELALMETRVYPIFPKLNKKLTELKQQPLF
ncbi:MAG: hypothetical protein COT73_03565 [Bdellovibrio sp. CG10_big_fil_rev_8_21_14_0_10_47_8]|nr:MAG: hypothetical protein COT73_03565 [Bdellovibrio sp. CG10_big_fil_rev_8_21_14_0_10_47_8]